MIILNRFRKEGNANKSSLQENWLMKENASVALRINTNVEPDALTAKAYVQKIMATQILRNILQFIETKNLWFMQPKIKAKLIK